VAAMSATQDNEEAFHFIRSDGNGGYDGLRVILQLIS
jgi:hypothetical protein